MKTFRTIFFIQAKRLLTKRNIVVFLAIGLILILLLHEGKNRYLNLIENKNVFKEMEWNKVKQYVYYDQYAGYGIKIFYIPSPFVILHSDSKFDEVMSNVNVGERLNINMALNEGFSVENSGFMDFLGILLIFAVICGLFFGFEITINEDYSKFLYRQNSRWDKFLKSIISNIILLSIVFLILIGVCLSWLLLNGINLFNIFIFIIVLEVIINLSFFIAVGTVIGGLNKKKSTRRTILLLLIIGFIFFIPWVTTKINQMIIPAIESNSNFEAKNFKILMGTEKRIHDEIGTYKNDGKEAPENIKKIADNVQKKDLKKIHENENERRKRVLNKIKYNQTVLSIFPVTSSISTNKEISSFGDSCYVEFYLYSQRAKEDFKDFIFKKKFREKATPGKVEPFISKDDDKNVFYGKSHLPFNFWLGVFLTPFYTVLLLFFSIRILKKRMKIPEAKTAYKIEKEKDNTLFVHCKNETIKEDIFNFYQRQGACCLEKINTGDFMFNGVKAQEIFKHLCQVSGIDEQKALENLKQMGIKDLRGLPVCHEVIYKIYAAVTTAADSDLIVMNDFLKNESRELEKDFLRLLLFLEKAGKKVLYLSCQMWNTSTTFEDAILSPVSVVNGFTSFPMNVNNISVR